MLCSVRTKSIDKPARVDLRCALRLDLNTDCDQACLGAEHHLHLLRLRLAAPVKHGSLASGLSSFNAQSPAAMQTAEAGSSPCNVEVGMHGTHYDTYTSCA